MVKGAFFYDACTKVPFIMRYPQGQHAGERVKSFVQPHDLAATILSLAGFSSEELRGNMPESIDLSSLARGEDQEFRDYAVCMYRGSGICKGGGNTSTLPFIVRCLEMSGIS